MVFVGAYVFRSATSSVAEPRAEEPKLILPPGAGAEPKITNCGSGSGSGSFLFIKDLKKFVEKKSWLLKKFL